MIESRIAEKLNKKLETLVLHLQDLKVQKKDANASFKEQIDECQDKINALAEALKSGDKTFLAKAFDSYEIEAFEK